MRRGGQEGHSQVLFNGNFFWLRIVVDPDPHGFAIVSWILIQVGINDS